MPIDLKWVRSDPNQVREWQNLRQRRVVFAAPNGDDSCVDVDGIGCNNDDATTTTIDLVDAVLRKDELSRKNLQDLQEHKKCLKQLQLRLRPKKTPQPVVKKNDNEDSSEKKLQNAQDQQHKKQQESLSPSSSSSSSTNRENLMKEKKVIETKIRLAEADWKASLKDTHKTLCKLASPVTIIKPNGDGEGDDCGDVTAAFHDPDAIKVVMPPPLLLSNSGCPRSSLGMDLEQAWRQYTLRHFAAYLWVELPRGVSVVELSSDNTSQPPSPLPSHAPSINLDRAHELWGPICQVSSSTTTSSSSSKAEHHPVVMLPSWIRLLTESLPNKSIWGEKELPRYTAIWSSPKENYNEDKSGEQDDSFAVLPGLSSINGPFSLELVAISAPSVVDAREIQINLVEELLNYYGNLLMVRGDEQSRKKLLKRVIVAPPDLHNHEWSRIEIHFQLHSSSSSNNCNAEEETNGDTESRTKNNSNNINTLRLGWVSHWGDAATRACDMAFAGGGVVRAGGKNKYSSKSMRNASTKEYVHLVEASVIENSSSMWNKILYANSNATIVNSNRSTDDADLTRRKEKQLLVDVPPVLVPYLIRPIPNSSSIPSEDFFVDEKSKRKKKETVFGVRGDTKDTSIGHNEQQEPVIPCNNSRMGMSELDSGCTKDQPRFPPFGVTSAMSQEELQERIRMEKLSCPYDFLFE
jgi:hypothetical protein